VDWILCSWMVDCALVSTAAALPVSGVCQCAFKASVFVYSSVLCCGHCVSTCLVALSFVRSSVGRAASNQVWAEQLSCSTCLTCLCSQM
jgi:hypothetical protein